MVTESNTRTVASERASEKQRGCRNATTHPCKLFLISDFFFCAAPSLRVLLSLLSFVLFGGRNKAKLQDAVPPFPTPLALEVLEEELGRPPSEVFSELSEEPIAAASLAQVQVLSYEMCVFFFCVIFFVSFFVFFFILCLLLCLFL